MKIIVDHSDDIEIHLPRVHRGAGVDLDKTAKEVVHVLRENVSAYLHDAILRELLVQESDERGYGNHSVDEWIARLSSGI